MHVLYTYTKITVWGISGSLVRVSHVVRVRGMLCMLVFVMCVAPPTHAGAWSMAVLLDSLVSIM